MQKIKIIGSLVLLASTIGLIYSSYIFSTLFDDISDIFSMDD